MNRRDTESVAEFLFRLYKPADRSEATMLAFDYVLDQDELRFTADYTERLRDEICKLVDHEAAVLQDLCLERAKRNTVPARHK